MKIILRTDVPNLGNAGAITRVADGYGRNFLLPRGMAQLATPGAVKSWKAGEERRKERIAEEEKAAGEMGRKLSGMVLSYNRPVGEGGKLFGSVGKSDILKSLKASGLDIHKDSIRLLSVIKVVGDCEVEIVLRPGISSKIKVKVTARNK